MWLKLMFSSAMLGIGLAMDAFSVSLANGLHEPTMKKRKLAGIAGVFAGFQFLMPMIGWICVHTVAEKFKMFEKMIPWIALALLAFIGGKMIYEGIKKEGCDEGACELCFVTLILQGIATSIDALSVGFTIAEHGFLEALASCAIIGVLTFFICVGGLLIGRKFGTGLASRASLLGGSILIIIGLEIFITSFI